MKQKNGLNFLKHEKGKNDCYPKDLEHVIYLLVAATIGQTIL